MVSLGMRRPDAHFLLPAAAGTGSVTQSALRLSCEPGVGRPACAVEAPLLVS